MVFPDPESARHPLSMCFWCVDNAALGPMAEALARTMVDPEVPLCSAGLAPGPLDPGAVAAMAEIGVDLAAFVPRGGLEVPACAVRTWVCLCPLHPAPTPPPGIRRLQWGLLAPTALADDDPKLAADRYRRARDRIAHQLRHLIAELELRACYERAAALDEGDAPAPRAGARPGSDAAPGC